MLLFTLLIGRLLWIQLSASWKIIKPGTLPINEMAVRQRQEGIELDSGRGHIVDRNGVLLTGEVFWTPVLFPLKQLPVKEEMEKVASLLNTNVTQLRQEWNSLQVPKAWHDAKRGELLHVAQTDIHKWRDIKGVMVLPYMNRYPEEARGNQWLGFLAQQPELIKTLRIHSKEKNKLRLTSPLGAGGLERSFDRYLRSNEVTAAYYAVDGKGRAIRGLGASIKGKTSDYLPLLLHSTVDNTIQREIEKLTAQHRIEQGAVVVLDANNADIVAMVSRPFYNPKHIDLEQGEWSNSAVKAAVPGSIFKTVIAAAALEKGIVRSNEVFHCDGHYGKYGLSCWLQHGHGDITLAQGFAQSCNIVFATLGERLSQQDIVTTASALGLGRKIGWQTAVASQAKEQHISQIDQEEAGVIVKSEAEDSGARAQTAIGQRDVQMTPLQAANMIVTLLNEGIVTTPRLVSSISYKNGSHFLDFEVKRDNVSQAISPHTSHLLTSWMRLVVTEGTGKVLQSSAWNLAGKSGTAQVLVNKKPMNHQWFIGYGPIEKPQYAVAVLVKNKGINDSNQATVLFRDVMNLLSQHSR